MKKRNIVLTNGHIKSRRQAPPQDDVKGSFYQMLEKGAQNTLAAKGDMILLRDYLGGKEIKTSGALTMVKK